MHFELTIEDVGPETVCHLYCTTQPHICLELVLKFNCCMRVISSP